MCVRKRIHLFKSCLLERELQTDMYTYDIIIFTVTFVWMVFCATNLFAQCPQIIQQIIICCEIHILHHQEYSRRRVRISKLINIFRTEFMCDRSIWMLLYLSLSLSRYDFSYSLSIICACASLLICHAVDSIFLFFINKMFFY